MNRYAKGLLNKFGLGMANITASDFAIRVSNLPRKLSDQDHPHYEDLLKQHFEKVLTTECGVQDAFEQVAEVALIREYDGCISTFLQQGNLLEEMYEAGVAARLAKNTMEKPESSEATKKKAKKTYDSQTKKRLKLKEKILNLEAQEDLAVRLRLPALSPWAEWCYAHHSRSVSSWPIWMMFASPAFGLGLHINPAKCELIPCGGIDSAVSLGPFPPGLTSNSTTSFTLLGAPIGNQQFCDHTISSTQSKATQPLLHAISQLPDPQTCLLLLRHCASFCKIAYIKRFTPTSLVAAAFLAFDGAVRQCLETSCTGPLTEQAWLQASLSTGSGGLGLRHAHLHGAAAYAASVLATADLCSSIDCHYNQQSGEEALRQVNQRLPAEDQFLVPAPTPYRQQQLSQVLDKVTISQLTAPAPGQEAYRAHLQLLQQPGAGAWLSAPPSEALGLHIFGPIFKIMVRLRLRLPVSDADAHCPKCDGIDCLMKSKSLDCCPLDPTRAKGLTMIDVLLDREGGGWGPTAMQTWRSLAGLLAARTSEPVDLECQRLLQSLSVALQVENARAVLRRLS
ncbi:unnamed protein product [Durusdinium trenchii]|uniref:Uncharacterized protein n=1 Tax=Durusdinium trenchii TaxID=1381693 RepID=A0ABP0PSH8_9DINO